MHEITKKTSTQKKYPEFYVKPRKKVSCFECKTETQFTTQPRTAVYASQKTEL